MGNPTKQNSTNSATNKKPKAAAELTIEERIQRNMAVLTSQAMGWSDGIAFHGKTKSAATTGSTGTASTATATGVTGAAAQPQPAPSTATAAPTAPPTATTADLEARPAAIEMTSTNPVSGASAGDSAAVVSPSTAPVTAPADSAAPPSSTASEIVKPTQSIFSLPSELFGYHSEAAGGLKRALGNERKKAGVEEGVQPAEAATAPTTATTTTATAKYDPQHWATDKEITDLLETRLKDKAYVIAASVGVNVSSQQDNRRAEAMKRLEEGIEKAKEKNLPVVIPLTDHTTDAGAPSLDASKEHGTHWVTCVILPSDYVTPNGMQKTLNAQAFFLDSLGKPYQASDEMQEMIKKQYGHDVEFAGITGQRHIPKQQQNGSDCGYWAVQNAMALVESGVSEFDELCKNGNPKNLTSEQLRTDHPMGATSQPKPQTAAQAASSEAQQAAAIDKLETRLRDIQSGWVHCKSVVPKEMTDAIDEYKQDLIKAGISDKDATERCDALKKEVTNLVEKLAKLTDAYVALNRSVIIEDQANKKANKKLNELDELDEQIMAYKQRKQTEIEEEEEILSRSPEAKRSKSIFSWGGDIVIERKGNTFSIKGDNATPKTIGDMVTTLLDRFKNQVPLTLECDPLKEGADPKKHAKKIMAQLEAAITAAEEYSKKHPGENGQEQGASLTLGKNALELLSKHGNHKKFKNLKEKMENLKEKWENSIGQQQEQDAELNVTRYTTKPVDSADPAQVPAALGNADQTPILESTQRDIQSYQNRAAVHVSEYAKFVEESTKLEEKRAQLIKDFAAKKDSVDPSDQGELYRVKKELEKLEKDIENLNNRKKAIDVQVNDLTKGWNDYKERDAAKVGFQQQHIEGAEGVFKSLQGNKTVATNKLTQMDTVANKAIITEGIAECDKKLGELAKAAKDAQDTAAVSHPTSPRP